MEQGEGTIGANALAGPVSRRDRAVARVLDPARSRAEHRLQRFLDTAVELLVGGTGKEFTVQEVVERSGQSLRSFYQYFDSKQELQLAIFEDTVRTAARHLEGLIENESDPTARLRCFVVDYSMLCQLAPSTEPGPLRTARLTPLLADFAQQLLTDRPDEAARAFEPLTSLLEGLLASCATAGTMRLAPDKDIAGVILQTIMFSGVARTISGTAAKPWTRADAEQLWTLLHQGLGRLD